MLWNHRGRFRWSRILPGDRLPPIAGDMGIPNPLLPAEAYPCQGDIHPCGQSADGHVMAAHQSFHLWTTHAYCSFSLGLFDLIDK